MLSYELPFDDISEQKSYHKFSLKEAFKYVSHEAQIEYEFLQGGCQHRSHLISMILSQRFNIEHCKVWLFAPAALDSNDMRALYIDDHNAFSPNTYVNWNYHTAPVVKLSSKSAQSALLVFDPALNRKEPLPLERWLSAIGNSNIGKHTFLKPEKYFFNCRYNEHAQLTNVIDGTFFEYINPAKDNLTLEKGLAINDMTMFIYKKHIKPLVEMPTADNNLRLRDLQDLFGNVMAMDFLFAQNSSGSTDNTSLRYFLTHYPAIAQEAYALFHQRLSYWALITQTMVQ